MMLGHARPRTVDSELRLHSLCLHCDRTIAPILRFKSDIANNKVMDPRNYLKLVILHLILRACLAGLVIETSEEVKTSNLVKAVIKIVTTCHEPGVIGISGKSPDSLIGSLSSERPVVVIDDTTRSVKTVPVSPDIEYKLHLFVITTSSWPELEESLEHTKNTHWWNHMAHFYILDWQINENGCSLRAFKYLWTAWKTNLLNAKFVCTDGARGLLIYTFNPFTKDAPKPWEFIAALKGYNNHPWTLLMRKYREDRELCENMNFDRTENLGGYPIRLLRKGMSLEAFAFFFGLDGQQINNILFPSTVLFSSSNVTLIENMVLNEAEVIERRENLIKTMNEESDDIEFISRDQLEMVNLAPTYPHYQTGLRALTRRRGDETQFEKFLHVTDLSSRICMCVVGFVTLIIFKFYMRQSTSTAALNLIRMICNAAFTNLHNDAASRIFVVCLLIFVVTIQGIYQGQWAALLAKRKPLKDIDTMEELMKSNYTIYVPQKYRHYFDDPIFEGRAITDMIDDDRSMNCVQALLKESSIACINTEHWFNLLGAKLNLHVSRDLIVKTYSTWSLREDWPLEERMNIIIQRLVEAGIFRELYDPVLKELFRKAEANNNLNTDQVYKTLTLEDLNFAFVILGIGLGCSLICFIIEVGMSGQKGRSIVKISRRIRNRTCTIRYNFGSRLRNLSPGVWDFFASFIPILVKIIFPRKRKPPVLNNIERQRRQKLLRQMARPTRRV